MLLVVEVDLELLGHYYYYSRVGFVMMIIYKSEISS
jgi:hypothetical protein